MKKHLKLLAVILSVVMILPMFTACSFLMPDDWSFEEYLMDSFEEMLEDWLEEEYDYEFNHEEYTDRLHEPEWDYDVESATDNYNEETRYPETELPSVTAKKYTRVDENGVKDPYGDYVLFGSYPQSLVTDSTLTSELDERAGTLPTSNYSGNWTSYEYYVSGYVSDYMWYQDIDNDYDGSYDYRGVYFTSYRPYYAEYSSSDTFQDDNGYYTSNVYWFEYEPIMWRILTEENGRAMLLCEMLIDSQAYQNLSTYSNGDYYALDGNGNIRTDAYGNYIYANNYAYSTIRAWLNDSFYNTAFSSLQKQIIQVAEVDNGDSNTEEWGSSIDTSFETWYVPVYDSSEYDYQDTYDNVFLLSEEEVTTSEYGSASYSTSDTARQKKTTDYAQCQGAYTSTSSSYAGNGYWWLRSPYYGYGYYAYVIDLDGYADSDRSGVGSVDGGVCPALWIRL